MARSNHIQNAFIAGEASPKFLGRTDTSQYNMACEDLTNMIVFPQGGMARRTGTIHVGEIEKPGPTVYDGGPVSDARIFPFYGSDGTRWQIVLTPSAPDFPDSSQYNRPTHWHVVNTDNEFIEPIYHQTGYSYLDNIMPDYYDLGSKGVTLLEIQSAQSGDVVFFAHGKIRPFAIYYNSNAATGFRFTMRPYPDPHEASLGGTGKDQWTQMPFLGPVAGPSTNVNAINLIVSGSNVYTLGIPSGSNVRFDPDWVGKYMKFEKTTAPASAVVVMITGFNSDTSLNAMQIGGGGQAISTTVTYGGSAGAFYSDAAWGEDKGWPRTVTFYEQRLVFGGTTTFPDYLWFSQVGNIKRMSGFNGGSWKLVTDTNYTDPVTTADAFFWTLFSERLNEIRWMSPAKTLTVGTNYREWIVKSGTDSKGIGVDTAQANPETPHGSAYVQAIRIENTAVFLQRTRRHLRELVYNLNEDSFQATNLNIMADHIALKSAYQSDSDTLKGFLMQVVMQEAPHGMMWALDSNGSLCSMTRERQQDVAAWHTHNIAGETDKKPAVRSLSIIQRSLRELDNGIGSEPDDLWMTVRRSVPELDGDDIIYVERMFIERLSQEWDNKTIEDNWNTFRDYGPLIAPVYMDKTIGTNDTVQRLFNGEAYGVIGGLPHGVGAKVAVVCNGKWFGEYVVSGDGKIDISERLDEENEEYWEALVGFNFIAQGIPVTPEVPATTGSSQGLPRRIDQITIHFYRTIGARFGRAAETQQAHTPVDAFEEILFKAGVNQSDPIPLFTGDKKVTFPNGYESRPKVVIQSHIPLPCHVTHITSRMMVYE